MFFFVYVHLRDAGRCQGVTDELGRVFGPGNYVYLLTFQLLNHSLNSGTFYPHAGTDRIDTRVLAIHGDLCPFAGFPCSANHFDDAFLDFGHFYLKELYEKARVTS